MFFHAQTLTGLWIGTLSNDSNTIRKDQSFEIALTEYKGKVYGYSRSEFIVDEVLYFVVKRVKGTIEGDICEVKDDEIIAFNFPGKLDKGIKVTSTFRKNKSDSAWYLDGSWRTNKTKNYYAVSGKVSLEEEKDLNASKIFPHLEELQVADEIVFYKERKQGAPIVKIAKPEKIRQGITADRKEVEVTQTNITSNIPASPNESALSTGAIANVTEVNAPVIKPVRDDNSSLHSNAVGKTTIGTDVTIKPSSASSTTHNKKPVVMPAKEEELTDKNKNDVTINKVIQPEPAKNSTSTENSTPKDLTVTKTKNANNKTNSPVVEKNKSVNEPVVAVNKIREPEKKVTSTTPIQPPKNSTQPLKVPVVNVSAPVIAPNKTIETNKTSNETVSVPVFQPVRTTVAERNGTAIAINERKTEVSQVVHFSSDSLQLALYDNGQIDGDTVSVLMNGEVILSKQGLKASAIRKTVYINQGSNDEFTLVLYAENLGSYPPNTGLLVVRDGDDVYNLRFSSDFEKNAAIVFRRKTK